MEQSKLLSYSLLSHLINQQSNKNSSPDLYDVFLPMVEHTLFLASEEGISKGSTTLIEEKFSETYLFSIPSSIIQNILLKISEKYSSDCFNIYADYHFTFEGTSFIELEWKTDKEETNLYELEHEYNDFLIEQNITFSEKVSIFKFITNYSLEMSKVFLGETCSPKDEDEQVKIAALFINYASGIDRYNETIKGIYLGSLIAAYIGKERTINPQNKFEFLIDTSFILSLLGFNSELSYKRCHKIHDICIEQKFNFSVLNITIKEIKNWIRNFSKSNEFHIENLSRYKSFSKAEIQRILNKLENIIKNDYNVTIINFTDYEIDNIIATSVHIKNSINDKNNSDKKVININNAIAEHFIKSKRDPNAKEFYSIKNWFITDHPDFFITPPFNALNHRMYAEHLLNILWFSCPSDGNVLADINLSQLISKTLNRNTWSEESLSKLSKLVIDALSDNKIDNEDIQIIEKTISSKTITNYDLYKISTDLSEKAREKNFSTDDLVNTLIEIKQKKLELEKNDRKKLEDAKKIQSIAKQKQANQTQKNKVHEDELNIANKRILKLKKEKNNERLKNQKIDKKYKIKLQNIKKSEKETKIHSIGIYKKIHLYVFWIIFFGVFALLLYFINNYLSVENKKFIIELPKHGKVEFSDLLSVAVVTTSFIGAFMVYSFKKKLEYILCGDYIFKKRLIKLELAIQEDNQIVSKLREQIDNLKI